MTDADFYASLPAFDAFAAVVDPSRYRRLPPSWWVGMTDVVGSTRAIEQGRYKAVNTAGEIGYLGCRERARPPAIPVVFGGDGASFAVCGDDVPRVRETLAATIAWSRDELDLPMRAALVPMSAVEAAGYVVSAARYAPSPHVSYAMFSGGGLAWVERAMKSGDHAVAALLGTWLDLSGLSCRWSGFRRRAARCSAAGGAHAPGRSGVPPQTVESIVEEIDASGEAVRPVPSQCLASPGRRRVSSSRCAPRAGRTSRSRRLACACACARGSHGW